MTILVSTHPVDCITEEETLMPGSAVSLKWTFLAPGPNSFGTEG